MSESSVEIAFENRFCWNLINIKQIKLILILFKVVLSFIAYFQFVQTVIQTPACVYVALFPGSMEVVRLVEEIRSRCGGIRIQTDEIYVSPTFLCLTRLIVLTTRDVSNGGTTKKGTIAYRAIEKETRNGTVRFPAQLFIANEFCDASDGGTFDTINPTDESVICAVAKGTNEDVNRAVGAAGSAFVGEWGRMNARDRGGLMFALADLMEKNREELATIEAIDSGAVYTLALKTHVGMSIDAFR